MPKYIKLIYVICILLPLYTNTATSQTVEVQGFIPNKGQFSKEGVLGQFCGSRTVFLLTDSGLTINLVIADTLTGKIVYKSPGKYHIGVKNTNKISFDSIELYDSSSNTLNYYLAHCDSGILDVRAYKRILIKSILPGIDWEIRYNTEENPYIPFYHKFIQLDTNKPKVDIILQRIRDKRLWQYKKDTTIYKEDTLEINTDYMVLEDDSSTYTGYVLGYSIKLSDNNSLRNSDDWESFYWDWYTFYNANSTDFYVRDPDYLFPFDLVESSTDISGIRSSATDSNGNYYIVGASIINAQERSTKDSVNYYTEAFISKFDKNARLLWTTFYGSSLSDIATTIAINSKNDIYLSGHINLHPLKDDLQKISLDSNYKPTLWKNDFPTKRHNNDSYFSDTIGSLFLLKLDTNGKRQWATLIGKDYGKIDDKFYMIDCEFFTSTTSSKDDIYFSGTYRPSLFRNDANDKLPSIAIREQEMGLQVRGDANTTWTMKEINAAAPNRFSGTNQWNVYPFILKLDSNDNLVWSTYFFTTQPIAGMAIDSRDNLYIGGNSIESGLPVKRKEGAFYREESFFKEDNLDLPILDMARRAYIAEFDKNNKLTWCTYLENEVDSDKNTITAINDIDIGLYDNLLLTGYSTNTKFPLQRKGNAYFEERDSNSPTQNTFIMEFDSNNNLRWSTLYIYNEYGYWTNSWGLDIEAMLDGDIFLALSGSGSDDINSTDYDWNLNSDDLTDVKMLEFNKNYNLERFNHTYAGFAEFGNKLLDRDIVVDSFSFEKYDNYKDVNRLYNFNPAISLKYTAKGRIYLSGALSTPPYFYHHDVTITYNKLSFFSVRGNGVNWRRLDFSDKYASSLVGYDYIRSKSLCDSVGFAFPFTDSLLCIDMGENIPLKTDSLLFNQFSISWYKNNNKVDKGGDYTITDEGIYYFIADNIIYSDCPSYYSDTVIIVYDTIDLDFRKDTIDLCVGVNNYVISAYRPGATYFWNDGSTDSTYTIHYKGDSIDIIWCTATNVCGGEDTDSVTVRFYPPYAYLGEDTVLCRGDSLNFDASILNKNLPAQLEYRWFLNGNIVSGDGENNELFTITETDSGQLILHAIWDGTEPKLNCDTAVDTLNFSYYQYDNVGFYLPSDTTICFYEEIRVDLIANKIDNIDPKSIYLCLNSVGDTISQKSIFMLKDSLLYYISASNYCYKQKDTLKLRYFNDFNIEMLQPIDTAICTDLFPTEIYGLTTEQIDGICYWLSENKEDTIEIAPSRYINQDGTYPIILSDIYNCSQDYDIIVSLKEDCEPVIDMPNVFTPNSDGVNDFFKIISADNIKDFDIVIFNKAGTKVYDYKGLIENFAWNGCYKNSTRDVPEGAYFFVILYKDVTNATRKQAGALTLLR